LTLGHYGLPHIDGKKAVVKQYERGNRKIITASIEGRSLALIAYNGWDRVTNVVHKGRNAEAEESTVLYAYKKRTSKNPPMELMITVMIHKMNDAEWTEEELSQIEDMEIKDISASGSPLGANIILRNGKKYEIDFKNIDGRRSC
jgi:hypothetical protein